jgi:hypothetical protein
MKMFELKPQAKQHLHPTPNHLQSAAKNVWGLLGVWLNALVSKLRSLYGRLSR